MYSRFDKIIFLFFLLLILLSGCFSSGSFYSGKEMLINMKENEEIYQYEDNKNFNQEEWDRNLREEEAERKKDWQNIIDR